MDREEESPIYSALVSRLLLYIHTAVWVIGSEVSIRLSVGIISLVGPQVCLVD